MTSVDQTTVTKDFTRPKKNLTFKLDDDIFTVREKLATNQMMRLAEKLEQFKKSKTAEQSDAITDLLHVFLIPESASRFVSRWRGEAEPPIDVFEARDVIQWVMEELGMRPTEQSKESLDGSENPEPGTSSTESVSETVSISTSSPSTAS